MLHRLFQQMSFFILFCAWCSWSLSCLTSKENPNLTRELRGGSLVRIRSSSTDYLDFLPAGTFLMKFIPSGQSLCWALWFLEHVFVLLFKCPYQRPSCTHSSLTNESKPVDEPLWSTILTILKTMTMQKVVCFFFNLTAFYHSIIYMVILILFFASIYSL